MRYFLENGKRLENMLNKDIYKSVSFSLVSFSVRCIDSLNDSIVTSVQKNEKGCLIPKEI